MNELLKKRELAKYVKAVIEQTAETDDINLEFVLYETEFPTGNDKMQFIVDGKLLEIVIRESPY